MFIQKRSPWWILTVLCASIIVAFVALLALSQSQEGPNPILPHDVDRLPNGHTLITTGGPPPATASGGKRTSAGSASQIIEIDRAGQVVWSFSQGLLFAHNADPLSNNHMLISDTGNDRVIEIDAQGKIVWSSDEVSLSDGSALRATPTTPMDSHKITY
jgi:hypothetical protein